jgi:putative sigma-54 modulation protein
MKITYTGRQIELAPAQVKKIEARGLKLAKLLDGKGEREAHVTLSLERGRHTAEVTIQYFDHPLIGEASNPDLFTAIFAAIEKLEKQAVKVRTKRRDTKRGPREQTGEPEPAPEIAAAPQNTSRQVFRVSDHNGHKPMTLDEAVLEMEKDRDYLVYRDAVRDRLSVLMRRRDGNFDLVEC